MDASILPMFLIVVALAYIVYLRIIHPLSVFPGPFLASLTNFWRFYHELRGDLPTVIHRYHQKYGAFVRVAPNEINTDSAEVIDVVYKGGRHYPKSDFYDGFTAVRPNIFGTRNEDHHALRRRQMAHAFSQASLVKMEYIFDRHVENLLEKLDRRADEGSEFSLDTIFKFFSQDVNGELSVGVLFGTQKADNPALVPPLNDHIMLAKLTGYVPWIRPFFNRYGPMLPWPYLRKLLHSRGWVRAEANRVTDLEFERTGRSKGVVDLTDDDIEPGRVNLFTSLVRAKDPTTGEPLDRDDVVSNAITFLTAGSHSTSATLEILFWYLLHFPEVMEKARQEIDDAFGPAKRNSLLLPYAGLEAQLPYTSSVLKECFRLSPTFQHPAPRLTPSNPTDPKYPTVIDGKVIPPGYPISASVFSLHHSKKIWGPDADKFLPGRWSEDATKSNERIMMHFGSGHRACIGRNQSMIMLWKVVVEVLRRYDMELASKDETNDKIIELKVRGFAELVHPLAVKAERRTTD